MTMKKWIISVLLFFCIGLANAGDVVVANGQNSVSASDLKQMFLGKKKSWANGDKVVLVILKDGAAHDSFMSNRVGKSPSQFLSFWKKLVFTGKGVMPKQASSEAELLQIVASTKGAIGYVSEGASGSLPGGVSKVTVK